MEPVKGRPPAPLRDRARYLFDRTLARSTGTLMGWLVLICLAVVVPVSTVLVWTDPAAPRSLADRLTAVWRTSAETLRLGSATGAPLRLALSALLGLVALLGVSTLVGVVTTGLADRMAELSRGRSRVLEHGHVVVLGWSDQATTVVSELVAAQAPHRPRAVVLLADRDKAEMERALAAHLPLCARGRIICRSGPASDPEVLALVSPHTASTVLVLPSGEPAADAEVLRVLLSLRAVLGEGTDGPPVLAAVRDDRYRAPARLAAGPRGTVLETDTVTARLIAQCVGRPGLSLVLRDLLDFAGDEFHLADATAFHGDTFGTALLGHPDSCAVGLLTPDGRTLLNPPAETPVEPGSRLIVLALDDAGTRVEDCRHLVDPAATATDDPPPDDDPTRLLVLGWNRRAPLVVGQLRDTARPGSVLDVITDSTVPAPREPVSGTPTTPPSTNGTPEGATVRFRSAELSRPDALLGLDLTPYDGLVVLGPDPGDGPDRPDDWTLVTLLALRLLEERAGRELRVVTELTDDRNRPLAPVNHGSDVIVSGKLTGLLMAQITQNRHLAPVFDELFSGDGANVLLRPAGTYVRTGAETTFATVVAAARDRGDCAIGYRCLDRSAPGTDHGVRLNPPKGERRVWSAGDQVVVVGTPPGNTAATARSGPSRRGAYRDTCRADPLGKGRP
ncbi:NAD-binding lipoprotein [Streptomyces sp. NPDC060184]|uniref:CASTOR/POLLUX-related putative ion channel n=1 Tax=Streptomyces sp. NPDC060184 TaxID=3347064 RepID=UPI003648AEAA